MTERPGWASLSKEQRIAIIAEHARRGETASRIAEAFTGASRNAVIGYLARHQIKLVTPRGAQAPQPSQAAPVPKTVRESRPGPASDDQKQEEPISRRPLPASRKEAAFEPLDGIAPVRIEDMPMLGRCRWPVNGFEGAEPIMCLASSSLTETYCASHRRLAYRTAA